MTINAQVKELSRICGEDLIKGTLKKIAEIEIAKYRQLIDDLSLQLRPFEKKYNQFSASAWKKYKAGKLDDDTEIMEWMAVYQNFISVQKTFDKLQKTIK